MRRRADVVAMLVLAIAPLVALAPAWSEGRLLGPGDGAALHYPLRVAVWDAFAAGTLPAWNPAIFLGAPLLGTYRAGAFFPPTMALTLLPDRFAAFQVLVLLCLAAAGPLLYLYLRRLGAHPLGGLVAGLGWALGPYFVAHLGDTATVTAAPALPLLLLAAEAHMRRAGVDRAAGLALAIAFLVLAGSPEASRAGLTLLAARVLVAYVPRPSPRVPPLWWTALAVLAGLLLAGPQLVPALDAARDAGREVSGLAVSPRSGPQGITGLALRYLPTTPAPALALAALPLFREQLAVKVLGAGLGLALLLQWGRGPLGAPGALPLVFDLSLNVLAGLSLSAQWVARREVRGTQLRALFLAGSLLAAFGLSVGASAGGPLPQAMAGSVGLLAVAQILYHAQARSPDRARATAWVLPLIAAFLMHPYGRGAWDGAPTRDGLGITTPLAAAVERTLDARRGERVLSLVERWPSGEQDLLYGNLAGLVGRRSANGYDPAVPLRTRMALGGMGPGGQLPGAFFRSEPARLLALGIGFAQVPGAALASSRPERIDLVVGREARFFPLPMSRVSEVTIVSSLADAVNLPQGAEVAVVEVRLATGRSFSLPLRAGIETAEWAAARPDVKGLLRHAVPTPAETWQEPDGTTGARYLARLPLPGRYWVDGVRVTRNDRRGVLTLFQVAATDGVTTSNVSAVSAFVSDTAVFRERLAAPGLRLFDLPASLGEAWVVDQARVVANDREVLAALQAPSRAGVDLAREALVTRPVAVRGGVAAGRAQVSRPAPGEIDVHAAGPGLLVVAEGWDPGWHARVGGQRTPVHRVNLALLAVELPEGLHHVTLRHRPRGFRPALAVSLATAVTLLAMLWWRRRHTRRPPHHP